MRSVALVPAAQKGRANSKRMTLRPPRVKDRILLHLFDYFSGWRPISPRSRPLATKGLSRSLAAYANYALALSVFNRASSRRPVGFEESALDRGEQGVLSSAVEAMCEAAECCLLTEDLDHFLELVRAVQDPKLNQGRKPGPCV